jgi:WD40 repeat protein/tRNA A-37 threonylcarbamoyl transferase component Bud32
MGAERTSKDEIFNAAAELADADERAAFLDNACANNPHLREEIEDLLDRDLGAASFLESPPSGLGATVDHPISEKAGNLIGNYKLMEQIGEGGMGTVYVAQQERPVRRKVALKIIKPGMDTKDVMARFEAERQALALMEHSNIARVFDAGATESGRPYFVMELVRGIPITEYCDQNHLSLRERLKLFGDVCQAIQHAHQKGIIHRDVKPSNVMITLHDGTPVVKVIDFGVAKAINQRLTEQTVYTRYAQMIGTPLYMSPEQAEMSGLDVDTRSDIYSLGVLLYELLTGATPFDRERLHTAAYDEVRRIIREEEHDKPSTRVSTMGDASVTVSARRSTDPTKLKQLLRGELDWIVMKALEKDRSRRYETASALAAEVIRYLNGEPVEACPPSKTYRLRKFARRYKSQVAVAAGFLILLLTSSAVAWVLYVHARRAKIDAVVATAEAVEARRRAVDAMDEIQAQRDKAEENFRLAQEQEQQVARLAEERQRRLYDYNLIKANIAFQQDEELKTAQLLADCLEEQRGWEWHRLNRLTAAQRNLKLAGPSILFGDTSPTESRVAVVDSEGNLRLCDLADGQTIWSGRTAVKGFPITMFSPAGDLIAVYSDPFGGGSGRLEVWDATGQMLWTASRDQDRIGLVSFSPDGRYLSFSTFGPGRASLALHHPRDPTPVWQRPTPGLALMAFDQAAKKLFMTLATSPALVAETKLCCWSVEEPSEIWSVRRSTASLPCLTPDGFLLTGGKDHTLEIRDPASGTLVEELASSAPDTAFDVRCSPDGRHIISAGDTGHIVLWDWKSRSEKLSIKRPVGRGLRAAFTHDSDYFLVVRPADSTVELRSVDRAPAEIVLSGHEQAVKGVAFSLDGKEVVSTSFDGTLRKWNATSGQEVRTKAVDASPAAMAYSPRGTHIATGGRKVLSLWNSETGELVHQWPDAGRVRCLEFSPDGKRLIAGASDKGLKLFDVETGHKILSKETPQGIRGVAFCADGRRAVSLVSQTGQIDLWDVESSSGPQSLRPAGTGDIGLALIGIPRSAEPQPRDDNLPPPNLVAAGINNTIELWDIDAGQKLNTLRGHDDKINCLTPNHDGSRLFSGDRSGVVKVWNLDTGEQLLTMQAHESHEVPGWEKRGVFSLALSPDGKTLATAGADKLVKLWETTHPSKRHAQQRKIVEQATRVVDQLDEQSGALRDVLESLTKDKSLDEQVLSVALDIAHARGQFIDAIRQSLKENIESSAGGDLGIADSTRISKWHN